MGEVKLQELELISKDEYDDLKRVTYAN